MPGTIKISQLTEDTTPATTDMIPFVDETAVVTKRVSVANLLGLLSSTAGGWTSLPFSLVYGANNGGKEFTVTATGDLTSLLTPGMKMQVTRNTAFASASSQYATKSSPSGITFTSAFTCEAWVYMNSYTGQTQMIVNRMDAAGTSGGWRLYITSGGQVDLDYGTSSSFTTFLTYQAIPTNQWVHIAGVISSTSSKTGAIYINGVSVSTSNPNTAATSLTQASVDLRIGAGSATPTNTYFNGYMSEVRVWSVAQTQSAIQSNMGINLVGTETNLVALFKGNSAFTDATSNANNLTATNSAIATQAANPYNAIEYANIRAISYSSPTTTITLFTSDAGTIPNETLNTPFYSPTKNPFGLPEVLNSKILGQIIWCTNITSTATGTGTQLSGATMTMTIPAGGKKLVIKTGASQLFPGSGIAVLDSYYGSVQVNRWQGSNSAEGNTVSAPFWASAGSQTFSLNMWETSSGTSTWQAGTGYPSWFTVEEAP
jgi:hypothetical protein